MKQFIKMLGYAALAAGIIILDRFAKVYALANFVEPKFVNRYMTFECLFNRGISWGMFSSEHDFIRVVISILVAAIVVIMLIHSYRSWRRGVAIIGEVMVIAGALSNLADRVVYRGVVDFIHLSCCGWTWPAFNVADMSIVLGVCCMLIVQYRES